MPNSGYFYNIFRTGYALRVEWAIIDQNIDDNTSTVNVTAYLMSAGNSYTISSSASKTVNLYINGVKYTKTASGLANLAGSQKKALISKNVTIAHDSDGTKSIPIYCTFGLDVTLSGTHWGTIRAPASGTHTANLSAVPQVTTPTTSGTWSVGNTVTIYTPASESGMTHKLQYHTAGYPFVTIADNVVDSVTWTLPDALAAAKPNAITGMVYIKCITYRNGEEIGDKIIDKSYRITASYASPSISVTASQTNTANIAQYIKGRSAVTLTASSTLMYSATAQKYVFSIGGITKAINTTASNASYTFTLPANATDIYQYIVTVTDSRGYTASYGGSFSAVAYTDMQLTNFLVVRGDYAEDVFTENPKGNNLQISFDYAITSLDSANAKKYKVDYRLANGIAYTELIEEQTLESYSGTIIQYTDAIFSENSAYVIRLSLIDSFDSVSQIVDVSSQRVLMNFSANGKAMAIGGIASVDDALEIMLRTYCTGGIKSVLITDGTDFDEIIKPGTYVGDASNEYYVNAPLEDGAFFLDVSNAGADGQIMQRYCNCNKNAFSAYVRILCDGTWGAWQPTEGFAEYFTDAYSGRIRLANGLMMQWGRVSITPDVANIAKAVDIMFPVEFAHLPVVQTSTHSPLPNVAHVSSGNSSTSGITLYLHRTNTIATWVSWFAIGRG